MISYEELPKGMQVFCLGPEKIHTVRSKEFNEKCQENLCPHCSFDYQGKVWEWKEVVHFVSVSRGFFFGEMVKIRHSKKSCSINGQSSGELAVFVLESIRNFSLPSTME